MSRRTRDTRSILPLLLAISVLAGGCGSEAEPDARGATGAVESDAVADSGATVETAPETTSPTDPEPRVEASLEPEATSPWPAPALPISAVYEFDQRVQGLESFDDELFFFDIATMYKLDPESGEISSSILPTEAEHNVLPVYTSKSDTHLVLAGSQSDWGFDRIVGVDPGVFERTADLTAPPGDPWIVPMKNTGSDLIVHRESNALILDTETMTLSDPLSIATSADVVYRDGDSSWIWRLDGTGSLYDSADAEIASFNLGREQARFMHGVVAIDESFLWHGDNLAGVLTQFDRATGLKVQQVDLSGRYGEDAHVELAGWQDVDNRFVILQVERGEEGWFVLVEINTVSGEVLSDHVFAPTGPDAFGTILFDLPEVETVGNRVFIRDHRRRIVEIDTERLGKVDDAWEAPAFPQEPVLSPDETLIGEVMIGWTGDFDAPTTDPELAKSINLTTTAQGPWEVLEVVVDGDRAWGNLVTTRQDAAFPLVLRRIDDEWRIETLSICLLSFNFGTNDCEL